MNVPIFMNCLIMAPARRELIELGAHTVTHTALPALPEASQREEIRQCKPELEQLLGRPVTSFAYPYGQYAAETAALWCGKRNSPVRARLKPAL